MTTSRRILMAALLFALAAPAFAESILRRDNGSEPATIDPQLASEDAGGNILTDTFEGLVTRDAKNNIIPGVAKSWTVSDDGKHWTFHLRDAKWSDGTPVTAEDFVYAWRRAVNPALGSSYAFVLFPLKNAEAISSGKIKDINQLGIKAVDDHTLEVTLENPTPYFMQLLTHYTMLPVPKHVVEKYGKKWTRVEHIVSNGPFHLSEWTPYAHITAVKSKNYWDNEGVKLDKVIYYPIENASSSLSRYRAGELDIGQVPLDQIDWVKSSFKDQLHVSDYLATYYYGFNLAKPPFKDNPKLRRALSMAVDRDVIVKKVLRGGQTPAYNIVPPKTANSKVYEPQWSTWPRAKQIAEAKKLYAEAGYSKDKPLNIELLYNTNEDHKKIAIAVASMWKQILGVETKLVNQEWKVMLSTVKRGDSTLFRFSWIGDYNDPNSFLELYSSGSGENSSQFHNEEFDALLAKANTQQDLKQRAETLYQADKIFTDADAIIPLYHYVRMTLIKPDVKGFEANILGGIPSRYLSKEG